MGQTATLPRSSKSVEEEDVQGMMVAQMPQSREVEVQEPVFGSPIDSKGLSYELTA